MVLERWTNPKPQGRTRSPVGTGYNRVEGNRRASRNGRVSEISHPKHPKSRTLFFVAGGPHRRAPRARWGAAPLRRGGSWAARWARYRTPWPAPGRWACASCPTRSAAPRRKGRRTAQPKGAPRCSTTHAPRQQSATTSGAGVAVNRVHLLSSGRGSLHLGPSSLW
jgi:hypothetical protein